MTDLIAVPTWVLFFGIANLVLTLANVVIASWLSMRTGQELRREMAARFAEQMCAQPVYCTCAEPQREAIDGYTCARCHRWIA